MLLESEREVAVYEDRDLAAVVRITRNLEVCGADHEIDVLHGVVDAI